MWAKRGVAVLLAVIMSLLFAVVSAGILTYTRGSTELAYREARKTKAYYAAEAALQRAIYEVNSGVTNGTFTWWGRMGSHFTVGGQILDLRWTITDIGGGQKQIQAEVVDAIDTIKMP